MRYRTLGASGLRLSVVGLGSWLTFGDNVGEDQAEACIHRAFDVGINFFDTANEYAQGAAEESLGRALKSLPRGAVVVATKVYWPMGDGATEWGLSRKHIFDQVDASLARLGMDHIDLYQCHRWDAETPLRETCEAMSDVIKSGKARYWGVSEWTAEQLTRTVALCERHGFIPPVGNQPQYNALWRTIERSVLPVSASLGVGNVVWSPLAMGVLSGKYSSVGDAPEGTRGAGPAFAFNTKDDTWQDIPYVNQATLDAVRDLEPLAEQAGCTRAQLALAWCLRQPNVTSVITGARRPEQVEENAATADLDVDPELLEQMGDALSAAADFSAPTAPGLTVPANQAQP